MKDVHIIAGDQKGELVRRRIVVWRRLEPGDVMTEGGLPAPESPFLEARIVEIAIGKELHEDMVRLAAARAKATEVTESPMLGYEPGGMLIAAGGGIWVGALFDFLMPASTWQWVGLGVLIAGILVAFVSRTRRSAAELAARDRWRADPERPEHDEIARDLAQRWLAFAQKLRKDEGFHTDIRVAEGSANPLRLASIDPRPMQGASGFDPEDWLPTDGGGVRYETVHATGEIATKEFPGALEVGQSAPAEAEAAPTSPAGSDEPGSNAGEADGGKADTPTERPPDEDATSAASD